MNPDSLKIGAELGVAHPAVLAVTAANVWRNGDAHTLLVSLNLGTQLPDLTRDLVTEYSFLAGLHIAVSTFQYLDIGTANRRSPDTKQQFILFDMRSIDLSEADLPYTAVHGRSHLHEPTSSAAPDLIDLFAATTA
jgi:hypothetical protein